jgi:adenosylhomocysteinase
MVSYKIKNINLHKEGERLVYLAEARMPTLLRIREEFKDEKPLKGVTIGACLHVTRETAALIRTFFKAGANVALCGSNPLSTQDEVAAFLVEEGAYVYAWRGNVSHYYDCIRDVLKHKPDVLIDDGADLVFTAHQEKAFDNVLGAQEETTTGVNRLKAMERQKMLKMPVIAVNNAKVKMMFDNRYGTGQGVASVIKALNILFAGKTVVVAGYGWCSRGMAMRAKGLGAKVIITEVDPLRALEATMDGYRVMPMIEAIKEADIVFTATGCKDVVTKRHFNLMKDGVVLANLGHFDVEISVKDLERLAASKRRVSEYVDEYKLPDGKKLYLLAEGRLANLVLLGGHPPEVMDLSFSVQALTAKWLVKHAVELKPKVYEVPREIDEAVARMKLETMGVRIDQLTEEQKAYLKDFELGT